MYRYVRCTTNRSKALSIICRAYIRSGYKAVVNKEHNCVDVLDDSGNVVEQVYPVQSEPKERIRNNYVYVGEGNGDYVKIERVGTERTYDPYTTTVKKVSNVSRGVSLP